MTLEIDALGLLCPLPVLKARKALNSAKKGTLVRLLSDDPVAVVDIPHFCSQTHHEFIAYSPNENGEGTSFLLRSGGPVE